MKTMETQVKTVDNIHAAQVLVEQFQSEGYYHDRVYVLAYGKERTERIAEEADAEQVGITEVGVGTTIANLFRSHKEGLRAKMRSMGISEQDAARLEAETEQGKIVVIARGGIKYEGDEYDSDIIPYPPLSKL